MSYYETFLEKVNLLKQSDPLYALFLVKEELTMPYIEKSFEQQLLTLKDELSIYLPKPQKEIQVETDLFDPNKTIRVIEYLRGVNVRAYRASIEQFLKSEVDALLKGMMLMVLIEQQYYDEIEMEKDGLMIQLHPNLLELPFENEVIIKMHAHIEQHLNQYPSLLTHALDALYEKAISDLPFYYEESEMQIVLNQIYTEICTLFNEKSLLEKIIT